MKLKQTRQQRANTLDALHNMWPSVPPRNVSRNLRLYREGQGSAPSNAAPTCGTIACFGGWCTWWPEFRRQGVYAGAFGFPALHAPRRPSTCCDYDVAATLFGDNKLFLSRFSNPLLGHPADTNHIESDHAAVTRRLRWLMDNSEVIE